MEATSRLGVYGNVGSDVGPDPLLGSTDSLRAGTVDCAAHTAPSAATAINSFMDAKLSSLRTVENTRASCNNHPPWDQRPAQTSRFAFFFSLASDFSLSVAFC